MKISFSYSPKEQAPLIMKSRGISLGLKKSRLHLFNYLGSKGGDKYAVHAIAIGVPKLTSFEKRYYILQKDPKVENVYYKINKGSLQKRLNISSDELNGCIDNNYIPLIEQKLKEAQRKDKEKLAYVPTYEKDVIRNEFHLLENAKILFKSYHNDDPLNFFKDRRNTLNIIIENLGKMIELYKYLEKVIEIVNQLVTTLISKLPHLDEENGENLMLSLERLKNTSKENGKFIQEIKDLYPDGENIADKQNLQENCAIIKNRNLETSNIIDNVKNNIDNFIRVAFPENAN